MALDVRCGAHLEAPELGCQLFAGHEAEHAAAIAASGVRLLCTWKGDQRWITDFAVGRAAGRPWAPGFPTAIPVAALPRLHATRRPRARSQTASPARSNNGSAA
jgi:hypothetical protein